MELKDAKVLIATPNFTNSFTSEVHGNHIECATEWKKEGINFNWLIVGRTFVHFARTQACDAAIRGKYTHIFWVDDDAVIDPKILAKYIKADKEIIITPYPMRRSPHEIGVLSSTVGDFHRHDSYVNMKMKDLDKGLIEVDGGGTHAMLVNMSVFDSKPDADVPREVQYPPDLFKLLESLTEDQRKKIDHFVGNLPDEKYSLREENDDLKKPYFMMPKSGTEDMYFCYRAKKKGVKIWCDTDEFAGHIGFYPVIRKEHTEYYEKQQAETVENNGGVPVLQVREGSAHDKDGKKELPGVRGNSLDQSKSSSLA